MTIYFLRHASAGKKVLDEKKDERRPLDEDGILQARYIGRMLANLDVRVEHIISSPLKRATQTASLVANELAFEERIELKDALRPEANFEQFQAMLAHYGPETGVKMARKHLGWYIKGLPGSAEFRNRVNFVDDPEEVVRMVAAFYDPFLQRRAA